MPHADAIVLLPAAREAEVDGILTGTSPLDKRLPLFPAKATHQQLLGLVHRPTHPDKPAPAVPRERKWLGDNVGWEGETRHYLLALFSRNSFLGSGINCHTRSHETGGLKSQ